MPQPQIPPMQQHVPEAHEQQGVRQQREEKPRQAPQAAFCGEGRSAGLRRGADASVKMQGDIPAEDSSATAQPAAKSSVAADLREGHQYTGGCSADQLRAEDEPATATRLAQRKHPGAAAGTMGCGSEDSSSRRNRRDPGGRGNTKPTAAVAVPPADTVGSSAPASATLITEKLNAAATQVAGEAAASLSARTATGPGIQLETAATRETGAAPTGRAAPRPVRSSQEGLGDAALSRRVCAAVQLLVKTLVSTEHIVVSLAEMPQALRERPATLSFATVRAKILFSRYFFKNLKIYKAKRTRSFAVPAVVHTETGLIHASGSPIDWPRGLAALVLAAEDPAAAAGASTWPAPPAVPAAGRAGMLPATRTDDDGAAARAPAAGGWASPAAVVSVSSAPGAPSVTAAAAAAATGATAASSAAAEVARTAQELGVTSSTTLPGETLPSPQHRYSSKDSNSSSKCSTAATQKSKRSGDSPGSRSSPSEESSKASVLTSGSDTSFPEGGADSASQQPFLNPTPQHQHGWNTVTAARGDSGLPSTGRGIPVYATETAALDLSTCSSAARTAAAATEPTAVPAPTGEAGSTATGGTTAPSGPAAAGAQNVAAAGGKSTVLAAAEKRGAQGAAGAGTAAATATLYALVQGRDSSRLAAECSVRDIVSNRFLHRPGAAGGFTEEQRIIWEKSSSAPPGGAGPFEEREDSLKSSSSPFTLVSFVFSPLADKGVLSQSKDAAAERAVGAAQQPPAATNGAAARAAAASAGGQGGGGGGTAAARGREATADPNGGQQEEDEERRRGHSPRGVSFASGREDALKAASAAAAGAAAGTWGGDSCSASSAQEEECARINSLLQNEKLLGIRGSEKTGGTSKKKPRYKVSCSVVCGGDSWAIGRIELGSHCMSGQRSYNEDRVCVLPVLDTQDGSRKRPNSKAMFCAVYDGHNGEDAVNYVQEHLHRNIAKSKAFHGDMLKAIRAGFMATDTALRAMVCERIRNVGYDDDDVSPFSSGSTACTALLRGTQLYVGNLGDSRCVLSRAARSHLITVDHSCRTNAEEQRRVKQDGGHFDTDGYLSGALGVSRAFGAFDKKGGQKLSGLSGEPEIHRETLRREDEFMIIACDGVFDVVSCQEAVTCVRTHLREGKSADDAAMGLCQLAFQRHSLDNLSAVVAVFQSPEPLQKERLEKKEKRPTQHSRVPGETESSAAGGEGCRPRRKVINFSALKGLL